MFFLGKIKLWSPDLPNTSYDVINIDLIKNATQKLCDVIDDVTEIGTQKVNMFWNPLIQPVNLRY